MALPVHALLSDLSSDLECSMVALGFVRGFVSIHQQGGIQVTTLDIHVIVWYEAEITGSIFSSKGNHITTINICSVKSLCYK